MWGSSLRQVMGRCYLQYPQPTHDTPYVEWLSAVDQIIMTRIADDYSKLELVAHSGRTTKILFFAV
jgi:hypothetical protein